MGPPPGVGLLPEEEQFLRGPGAWWAFLKCGARPPVAVPLLKYDVGGPSLFFY